MVLSPEIIKIYNEIRSRLTTIVTCNSTVLLQRNARNNKEINKSATNGHSKKRISAIFLCINPNKRRLSSRIFAKSAAVRPAALQEGTRDVTRSNSYSTLLDDFCTSHVTSYWEIEIIVRGKENQKSCFFIIRDIFYYFCIALTKKI